MCVFLDDFSKHYNSRFEKYKSLCQSSIFKKGDNGGEKVDKVVLERQGKIKGKIM